MGRLRAAFGVVVLLAVGGGCTGGGEPAATVTSAKPVTVTATPTPTPTPEAADAECALPMFDGTAFMLSRGWDLVTASRGARDHEERVKSFVEDIDDLSDDIDDEPTQAAKSACGSVELAELAFRLSVLKAGVVVSGEAEDDDYQAAADAANAWVEKVGQQDTVEPFTATYKG